MKKTKKRFYKLIVGSTTLIATGLLGAASISCNFKRVGTGSTNNSGGDWSLPSTKPGITNPPKTDYEDMSDVVNIDQIFKNVRLNDSYAQKTPLDTFIKNYNNAFKILRIANATLPFERVKEDEAISEKYLKKSAELFATKLPTFLSNENALYLDFFGYYTEAKRVNDKLVVDFYVADLSKLQDQQQILHKEFSFNYPNLSEVPSEPKQPDTGTSTDPVESVESKLNELIKQVNVSLASGLKAAELTATQVKVENLVFKINNQVSDLVTDVVLSAQGSNSLSVSFKLTQDGKKSNERLVQLTGFKDLSELELLKLNNPKLFEAYNRIKLYSTISDNPLSLKAIRKNIPSFKLINAGEDVTLSEVNYVVNPFEGRLIAHFSISNRNESYRVAKVFNLQEVSNIVQLVNDNLNTYVGYYNSKADQFSDLLYAIIKFANRNDLSDEEKEIAKDRVLTLIYLKAQIADPATALAKVEEFSNLVASQAEVIVDKKRKFDEEKSVLAVIFDDLKNVITPLNSLNIAHAEFQKPELTRFLQGYFSDFIDNYYYGTKEVNGDLVVQNEYGPYGIWYISVPNLLAKNLLYRMDGSFADEVVKKAAIAINYFVSDLTHYAPLPYSKNTYGNKLFDRPNHVNDVLIAKLFSLINDDPNHDLDNLAPKLVEVYQNLIEKEVLLPSDFDKDDATLSAVVNTVRLLNLTISLNSSIYTAYKDLDFAVQYFSAKLSDEYKAKWKLDKVLENNSKWLQLAKNLKLAEYEILENTFTKFFDTQILMRPARFNSLLLTRNSWETVEKFVSDFNAQNKANVFLDQKRLNDRYAKFIPSIAAQTLPFEKWNLKLTQEDPEKPNQLLLTLELLDETNNKEKISLFSKYVTYVQLEVPEHTISHAYAEEAARTNTLASEVTVESLKLKVSNSEIKVKDVVLKPNNQTGSLVVSYKIEFKGKTFTTDDLVINGFITEQAYLDQVRDRLNVTLKDDFDRTQTYPSHVTNEAFNPIVVPDNVIVFDEEFSEANDETGTLKYKLSLKLKTNQSDSPKAERTFEFDGFKINQLAISLQNVSLSASENAKTKLPSNVDISSSTTDLVVDYGEAAHEGISVEFLLRKANDNQGTLKVAGIFKQDGYEDTTKEFDVLTGFATDISIVEAKAQEVAKSINSSTQPANPEGYEISNWNFTIESKVTGKSKVSFTLTKISSGTQAQISDHEVTVDEENAGVDYFKEKLITSGQIFGSDAVKASNHVLAEDSETTELNNKILEFNKKTQYTDDENIYKDDPVAVFLSFVSNITDAKTIAQNKASNNTEATNKDALIKLNNAFPKFIKLVNQYANGTASVKNDETKKFINDFVQHFFSNYFSDELTGSNGTKYDATTSATYPTWFAIPSKIAGALIYGTDVLTPEIYANAVRVLDIYVKNITNYTATLHGNFAWGKGKFIDNPSHFEQLLLPRLVVMIAKKDVDGIDSIASQTKIVINNLIKNDKLFTTNNEKNTRAFVDTLRKLSVGISSADQRQKVKLSEELKALFEHTISKLSSDLTQTKLKENNEFAKEKLNSLGMLLYIEKLLGQNTELLDALKNLFSNTTTNDYPQFNQTFKWVKDELTRAFSN
ncbi:hypothetical protein C4M96_00160 [Mycoplasmopsis pullorum]|uniref:lipoprotein 17-related variable surface protein n=3 Tax=Mycoplasmopsis pullorum TaxID=48003 RepID=UPI00111A92F4|nr:lipoprotein 17-related variable surface protein [Mycoplasmopsis pullorum]TNK92602.1 hypothetical protein C4M96_00160 [Mycoplasmopsis pullorum]